MKATNVTTPSALSSRALRLLRKRGISDETISLFRIEPNGSGWVYPVPNGGDALRFKNYESKAKPKYKWPASGKPEAVRYYHSGHLQDAIQSAGGVVWAASGEPDVWAMHSAGVHNVFCWFGETSVPATLAEDLRAWGVVELHMAPDLDGAGLKSAAKVRELLRSSGIAFYPHALPDTLGEKGDIGKAWQQYDGATSFSEWLLSLPHLLLPEVAASDPDELRSSAFRTPSDNTGWLPREGYFEDIAVALGVKNYKSEGWSYPVLCPFHEDTQPSASWHREKHILHCFRCGENFLSKDVGERFGIRWRDYSEPLPPIHPLQLSARSTTEQAPNISGPTEKAAATSRSAAEAPFSVGTAVATSQLPADAPCPVDETVPLGVSCEEPLLPDISPLQVSTAYGLPMELRQVLMRRKRVSLARVLDVLYAAGWEGGEEFTAPEAIKACAVASISKNTVREVLKTAIEQPVALDAENEPPEEGAGPEGGLSLVFTPIYEEGVHHGVQNEGQTSGGRPPQVYRLPTIPELCALLAPAVQHLNPRALPLDALASAKAYRIAFHRAWTELHPGPARRNAQAERLGVTPGTVRKYDEPAGLIVTPRTWRQRLTAHDLDKYTDNRKDRPGNEWIEDANGKQYPPTRRGLQFALRNGKAWRVVRQSNHYEAGPLCDEEVDEAEPCERGQHAATTRLEARLDYVIDEKKHSLMAQLEEVMSDIPF